MTTMRKMLLLLALAAVILAFVPLPACADGEMRVTVIPVEGEINEAMAKFLARELQSAYDSGADAVMVTIDTWGGFLTSVEPLSEALLDFPLPTIAYVTEKAVSAGVLVTISCDHIAMAPGSHIGAAETIPDTEKVLSAWVGMLTATAEMQGRPRDVIAAMADKRVVVPGYAAEGQLLDLTAGDAVRLGVADAVCATRSEALTQFGYGQAVLTEVSPTLADRAAGFLTSQVAMSLFFILGIVLLVIELFVPGFGIFGIGSIVCFGLYFFSGFLAGFTQWWAVVLFVAGLILMVVEMTMPGFGIFGIAGIVLLLAGLVFSSRSMLDFLKLLAYTLGACIVLIPILYKLFGRIRLFDRIVLKTQGEGTAQPELPVPQDSLLGVRGTTLTPLRPAGKAAFDGRRLDVISAGDFIGPNVTVRVVEAAGGRIVVEAEQGRE